MLRWLYSLFIYISVPFVLLRMLIRSRKAKGYRERVGERFGYFTMPTENQNGILIHAVSVGEAVAAAPLVRALQQQYPELPIVMTTTTLTGSDRVKALFGDTIFHLYMPYDYPSSINRFLKKVKPKLMIVMETELWPNLLYYAHRQNIEILLANARLSEKSAKGYAWIKSLMRQMLDQLTMIAVQTEDDARRFERLGALREKIKVVGSVKFDIKQPPSIIEAGEVLRQELGANRPVWIAASTREGEEPIILDAFKQVKEKIPDCLLLLVPRHPERFGKVANLCKSRGYQIALRSTREACFRNIDIYLGDSMGEMMLFYAASDIAFVGGSLVPMGGQNMLEPASFALPVIVGASLFNFAGIAKLLQEAKALVVVDSALALADEVIRFLDAPNLRQKAGDRAKAVVEANKGALDRHLEMIDNLLRF